MNKDDRIADLEKKIATLEADVDRWDARYIILESNSKSEIAGWNKSYKELQAQKVKMEIVFSAAIKWYHETDGFDSQALSDVIGDYLKDEN